VDARHHREMAFLNKDRDTRLEHQERADSARTRFLHPREPTWAPTQRSW
jgi:hypothetical protein